MSSRRAVIALVLATIALAGLAPAGAAASSETTIGTEAPYSGWEFGTAPYTATAGQTITVPAGVSRLTSFTLYSGYNPSSFLFRAYVYAWNGTRATGPALYESGDLHDVNSNGYEPVTVHTAVPVLEGQQYVLFLSRSADQTADEGIEASGGVGTVESEEQEQEEGLRPYQEGLMVTLNSGYDPADFTTQAWSAHTWGDLAFQATFDVPPASEPEATPPASSPAATDGTTVVSTISPSTPATARCVAPDLEGLTLSAAKQALKAAGCALGTVVHHYFTLPKGEVMEQDFHHGTFLPVGGKVDIWVSRGAHVRHHKRAG